MVHVFHLPAPQKKVNQRTPMAGTITPVTLGAIINKQTSKQKHTALREKQRKHGDCKKQNYLWVNRCLPSQGFPDMR